MESVSVVMCTYNGEKFLSQQIDSILQQTHPILELIIQDDGSTDGTLSIAESYALRYPFVHVYQNTTNLGFNENFRTAVKRTKGRFIALADQDDIWFPEKIAKQVAAIGTAAICCSPCVKGSELNTAKPYKYKFSFEQQLFASIYGHTMLCKREFLLDDSHWLPSLWFDWSITLFAWLEDGVSVVNEPLNWHREHNAEVTITQKSNDSPLAPYLHGYARYRRLQKDSNWQLAYRLVYERTGDKFPLVHHLCRLLLTEGLGAYLQLCLLCVKHRNLIYPTHRTHGLGGMVRAFFFPAIHAYYTTLYRNCQV